MGNTHRLNKWMVKFLLQHALALDDDDGEEEQGLDEMWTRSQKDVKRAEGTLPSATRLFERSRVARSMVLDMQMR